MVARLQRVRVHEVAEVVEVALELTLGHRHDERLGQFEEAAGLCLHDLTDSRAASDCLEGDSARHGERLVEGPDELPVRLELGERDVGLERSPNGSPDAMPGRPDADGPIRGLLRGLVGTRSPLGPVREVAQDGEDVLDGSLDRGADFKPRHEEIPPSSHGRGGRTPAGPRSDRQYALPGLLAPVAGPRRRRVWDVAASGTGEVWPDQLVDGTAQVARARAGEVDILRRPGGLKARFHVITPEAAAAA